MPDHVNKHQYLFREIVFGTLVYSLVLGFFADYTDVLHVGTQSTIFAAAIVLQLLTLSTFGLKKTVSKIIKQNTWRNQKLVLVFAIWLILFLSKFVFLWVIDLVFGDAVNISGFVGLMLIIVTMTIIKESIDYAYNRLAT